MRQQSHLSIFMPWILDRLSKIIRAYITNTHNIAFMDAWSSSISLYLEILRIKWKLEISRPRQPRREIHLASPLHKVHFVEDISSWNWLHSSIHPSVCTPRSLFSRNSRPSRRSIRKVKLLPEINYLLIRECRASLRTPLPFYGLPILFDLPTCQRMSIMIMRALWQMFLYCVYCADFSCLRKTFLNSVLQKLWKFILQK